MMPAYYLEIIVVGLGLLLLLLEAFVTGTDKRWIGWAGILGLAVVFGLNFVARGGEGVFWDYYTYEEGSFAGFFKGLALATTALVLLMGMAYLPVMRSYSPNSHSAGEFFVLPLFACAGLMWAASASDLVSIFVSIEVVTVAFYVLVAFQRRNTGSLEAGVKYLILGALSTGFMVYGIAWIFGATGQTNLEAIGEALAGGEVNRGAVLFGWVMLLVALGFKVGAFPFNLWIPDVYQGAPTPVTAFLSVGSKAAGFIVLLRVVDPFLAAPELSDGISLVLMVMAALTMVYGSLAAIPQSNMKRLLAYSSISNAGFILLAVACSPRLSEAGVIAPANVVAFSLGSYFFMTMLAFFVVTAVRVSEGGEDMRHYTGLADRAPLLAFGLLLSMAALAGVPLTSGFFSKFFVLQLAAQSGAWVLLGLALFSAAAGFYYYLKVIRVMYFSAATGGGPIRPGIAVQAAVVLLALAVLAFGIMPRPLLNLPGGGTAEMPVSVLSGEDRGVSRLQR